MIKSSGERYSVEWYHLKVETNGSSFWKNIPNETQHYAIIVLLTY